MLSSIVVMSGPKSKGKCKGRRVLIDKGAHKNGGAAKVRLSHFVSHKQALTAVLALTGMLQRVPYSGCASIILDGVKITGYFAPRKPRKASGRYPHPIERITVTNV